MLEELRNKWDDILNLMKEEYSILDVSFKTWILPLQLHSVDNDVVTIVVPGTNESAIRNSINVISKKYTTYFKVTISDVMGHEFDVKFISSKDIENTSPSTPSTSSDSSIDYESSGINPKYSFDTFVVGDNNTLAHASSLAVAESPGEIFNPLFIYGGVGLGKTHLMHAIGNFVMVQNPSLKVKYVTSETFTNDLIESIRNEKNNLNKRFRDTYRNVDVLLIDDIQFIIGKESTQEEFFHTFNALREAKKQIVISSDRSPQEFNTLEERLKSRFEQGLQVDIKPPTYETRMAILYKKAEIEGYVVDNDTLNYIATNVKSNIRELEGSLTKLMAYSRLTHSEINLEFAENALKDIISPNAHREVTPELIIQIVSEHYGISPADITSQRRTNDIAFPRQIIMYLCKTLTDVTYDAIGVALHKKDHSTISYGVDKISKAIETDANLRNTIETITKKINPS